MFIRHGNSDSDFVFLWHLFPQQLGQWAVKGMHGFMGLLPAYWLGEPKGMEMAEAGWLGAYGCLFSCGFSMRNSHECGSGNHLHEMKHMMTVGRGENKCCWGRVDRVMAPGRKLWTYEDELVPWARAFRKSLIGVDLLERTGPESDLLCGMWILSKQVHVLRLYQQQILHDVGSFW